MEFLWFINSREKAKSLAFRYRTNFAMTPYFLSNFNKIVDHTDVT